MEEQEKRAQIEIPNDNNKEPAPPWYQQLSFSEAKAIIRENIASASRSFISVGYYLKYIRDHGFYKDSGLNSIWEFAWEEYGISKSTASRYMTMNDRFSENGNSPIVAEEYRGYGKSQLQEMLYLTDEQIEQVTPETQVKQIREIRQPLKEIPYVDLPGQLSIEDFPDVMPEPAKYPEQPATSNIGSAVFTLSDLVGVSSSDIIGDEAGEFVAMSQREARNELDPESGESLSGGNDREISGNSISIRMYFDRGYTLADVKQDIAEHRKILREFAEEQEPPPIVKMTRMHLDAILMLWEQLEKEADPESSVRCVRCKNDVEIYDGYKYCPYCGEELWIFREDE